MRRNSPTDLVWLLDANIDIRVQEILTEVGGECRTAESLGWKPLSNGELVAAAASGGFTVLLTRDILFAQSASKTLKRFPQFAIVIVRLKQEKWPAYVDSFRKAWESSPIAPAAGRAISWPL